MLAIRSVLLNASFYMLTAIQMIVWSPIFFLGSRKFAWQIVHWWAHISTGLMRLIVGTRFEVRGIENLPETGAIIAPKHQSAWDTFCFLPWVNDPVYILKRELMWVPLFGWYVSRMNMIPIDRGNREQSIRKVNEGARREMAKGRQLVIYPEGTRRPPGATPNYKSGIAYLYSATNVPVVPVAHNAGLFWPKGSFWRYPGVCEMEFLEPIQPGLDRETFMATLSERLEAAADRLLLNAANGPNPPPLPPDAKRRVAELRQQHETV